MMSDEAIEKRRKEKKEETRINRNQWNKQARTNRKNTL